jgi:hypothetical protein
MKREESPMLQERMGTEMPGELAEMNQRQGTTELYSVLEEQEYKYD